MCILGSLDLDLSLFFNASVTRPSFSPSTIFSRCFSCCDFYRSYRLVQDVHVSLFSHVAGKKVPWRNVVYRWVIWLCQLLVTLFHLIFLEFMISIAFCFTPAHSFPLILPNNKKNVRFSFLKVIF